MSISILSIQCSGPGLMLSLSVCLTAVPAGAHDAPLGWSYDASCCSDRDCFQTAETDIKETPQGYQVASTGETIACADRRIHRSKDEHFHRCAQNGRIDAGRTLCLYVPDKGM